MNFNYFRAKRDKNLCVVVAMLIFLTLYCLVGAFTMDIVSAGFNQIDTLSKSTFNNGYVLNYPLKLDDEYAFPGHSIRFYKDDIKLVSTCIMELNDTKYTSNSIFGSERNVLGRDEIIISSNLVTKYNLCVGQKLKAYIPHSDDVKIYTVKGIGLDNYDITNLNLYEETGIILMGYDDEYISSINAKYIVFSNVSLAETIAQNPRSLDRVFSRLDLVINIVLQIMP